VDDLRNPESRYDCLAALELTNPSLMSTEDVGFQNGSFPRTQPVFCEGYPRTAGECIYFFLATLHRETSHQCTRYHPRNAQCYQIATKLKLALQLQDEAYLLLNSNEVVISSDFANFPWFNSTF
jgi:hypothetical protein